MTLALLFLTAALTVVLTLFVYIKRFSGLVADLPRRAAQYDLLEEVDALVRAHFFGEMPDAGVSRGAAKGYIEGLGDPYAAYLTAEEYARYQQKGGETLAGVGVETYYDAADGALRVVRVIAHSPAAGAGVQAGDVILSVGGEAVTAETQEALSALLQAEGGDALKLLLRRAVYATETETEAEAKTEAETAENAPETEAAAPAWTEIEVALSRSYAAPSCTGTLRDGVGYIRISRFSDDTDALFGEALEMCVDANVRGVMIDVRNNDGSNTAAAAKMIDRIVPLANEGTGAIATEKNAAGETVAIYAADAAALHLPVCVLVNSRTGGAAELFACDLREFGKATLIGEPTMGHGTVQQAFPLSNGDAVVLTVAEVYSYLGTALQGAGVTPDEVVPMSPAEKDRLFSSDPPADAQYAAALAALSD